MLVVKYNVAMTASKAVKIKKVVSKLESAFNAGMLTSEEARDVLRRELSGLFDDVQAAKVFINCGASFLSGVARYKMDYTAVKSTLKIAEVL